MPWSPCDRRATNHTRYSYELVAISSPIARSRAGCRDHRPGRFAVPGAASLSLTLRRGREVSIYTLPQASAALPRTTASATEGATRYGRGAGPPSRLRHTIASIVHRSCDEILLSENNLSPCCRLPGEFSVVWFTECFLRCRSTEEGEFHGSSTFHPDDEESRFRSNDP